MDVSRNEELKYLLKHIIRKIMKQKPNEQWTHYKFTVNFRILIQAAKGY